MNKAFTLAEVLITLGIIGIVAAMTIPALTNHIKAVKFQSQFKIIAIQQHKFRILVLILPLKILIPKGMEIIGMISYEENISNSCSLIVALKRLSTYFATSDFSFTAG